jgi:N-acyl-D-aspartate/D-glutamate deacylase
VLAAAAEGQDPLAVIHDIMSRDLKPELDTMVLAAAAQKSAVPQL